MRKPPPENPTPSVLVRAANATLLLLLVEMGLPVLRNMLAKANPLCVHAY